MVPNNPQIKAPKAQVTKVIPAECIILPSPTKGETMLPNKNPAAPKTADPVPACPRTASIASVVAAVKESPAINSSTKSSPSNTIIELSANKAALNKILQTSIPKQLVKMQFSWRLNLTDNPAPIPIATALTAKNRLNANGLNP